MRASYSETSQCYSALFVCLFVFWCCWCSVQFVLLLTVGVGGTFLGACGNGRRSYCSWLSSTTSRAGTHQVLLLLLLLADQLTWNQDRKLEFISPGLCYCEKVRLPASVGGMVAGENMLSCVFCTVPVGGDGCRLLWHPVQGYMGCKMKMQGYRFIVPQVTRSQANFSLSN